MLAYFYNLRLLKIFFFILLLLFWRCHFPVESFMIFLISVLEINVSLKNNAMFYHIKSAWLPRNCWNWWKLLKTVSDCCLDFEFSVVQLDRRPILKFHMVTFMEYYYWVNPVAFNIIIESFFFLFRSYTLCLVLFTHLVTEAIF